MSDTVVDTRDVSKPTAQSDQAEDYDRGFVSRSEEAAVRLVRVAGIMQVREARVLKHYGLSPVGHDILTVLRDAGGSLPARRVADAISTASPDLTRLLQRLAAKELIRRERGTRDKRVMLVSLTDVGRALLQQVAGPIGSLHKQMMGRLKKGERKDLVRILSALEEVNATRL